MIKINPFLPCFLSSLLILQLKLRDDVRQNQKSIDYDQLIFFINFDQLNFWWFFYQSMINEFLINWSMNHLNHLNHWIIWCIESFDQYNFNQLILINDFCNNNNHNFQFIYLLFNLMIRLNEVSSLKALTMLFNSIDQIKCGG